MNLREVVEWLGTASLAGLGGSLVRSALIVVLALFCIKGGNLLTGKFLDRAARARPHDQRLQTIYSLIRSIMSYAIYFVAGLLVLEAFGVRTGALLTGVGFVSLAVGIGAQSLVRDILNGFLILLEDQFTVGDYVTAAGLTGTVEEIGLRATRLREWTGELHIIPNGQIDRVTNYSRGPVLARVTLSVPYEADLRKALDVLRRACTGLAGGIPGLQEDPQVQGAVEFAESGAVVRVVARSTPMQHWEVERQLRLRLKEALEGEGMMLGYPRRVLLQREGEENGPIQPGGRGTDAKAAPLWE